MTRERFGEILKTYGITNRGVVDFIWEHIVLDIAPSDAICAHINEGWVARRISDWQSRMPQIKIAAEVMCSELKNDFVAQGVK